MRILHEEKETQRVFRDGPGAWATGETLSFDVDVTKSIDVRLTPGEFSKVENILALTDTQYQKFLKKFRR